MSIIMPVFNAEKFIEETLKSVISQTYKEWECICIDDNSSDSSIEIIQSFMKENSKIRLIQLDSNYGAAYARNIGIKAAQGKYLAFLDSDDVWKSNKLELQVQFMEKNDVKFSCTSYGKIDEESNMLNKICNAKVVYEYDDILKNCPGNSTVMYNCFELGKVYGPDISRRNDFAMWLKVIRVSKHMRGIEEVLSYHRVRKNSISYNKRKLLYFQWYVYRRIEKLGILKSLYLLCYKVCQTVFRRNG